MVCTWEEKTYMRDAKDQLDKIKAVIQVGSDFQLGIFGTFYINCPSLCFLFPHVLQLMVEYLIVFQDIVVCS